MATLTKRNCKVYFRNPAGVALSLIGALMVLLLFILFLGDNLAAAFPMLPDADLFVTAWMLAGMCAVAPLTSSLGVVSALVEDRTSGADRDFFSAPLPRWKIAGGYLASGVIASFLIGAIALAATLGWLVAKGGAFPSPLLVLQCVGVLALACVSSACLTFFIVSLVKKNSSLTAVSTLVGTLGGFLAGIYLPIGQLPAAMQTVIRVFPPSHAAVLLRSLLIDGMAADSYAGLPAGAKAEVWQMLGVRFGSFPLSGSILVLGATTLLFFGLSALVITRKRR